MAKVQPWMNCCSATVEKRESERLMGSCAVREPRKETDRRAKMDIEFSIDQCQAASYKFSLGLK